MCKVDAYSMGCVILDWYHSERDGVRHQQIAAEKRLRQMAEDILRRDGAKL